MLFSLLFFPLFCVSYMACRTLHHHFLCSVPCISPVRWRWLLRHSYVSWLVLLSSHDGRGLCLNCLFLNLCAKGQLQETTFGTLAKTHLIFSFRLSGLYLSAPPLLVTIHMALYMVRFNGPLNELVPLMSSSALSHGDVPLTLVVRWDSWSGSTMSSDQLPLFQTK